MQLLSSTGIFLFLLGVTFNVISSVRCSAHTLLEVKLRVLSSVRPGVLGRCSKEYVYDYITKLSKTQTEVILNHGNPNVRGSGQGEAGSIISLSLAAVRPKAVQPSNFSYRVVT
jgi:hypothetical protein